MKSLRTPNIIQVSLALAATTICAVASTGIVVPGLYNTGVDNSGTVLPQLSLEPHYTVSGPASIAYVVPPVYNASLGWAWEAAPAGSTWIGPNSTANTTSPDPVGIYHYSLQFDLTGFDVARLAISGSWMADNTAELFLNGNYTGFSKDGYGYKYLDEFTLNAGFLPGLNSLEFRVLNEDIGPNPTGLVVAGLTATLVPEPSSMAILLIGLSSLYLRKRCTQRA